MSSSATRLRTLLVKDAKVAEPIVDYVLHATPDGLGMESISDFASFWSKTKYTDGVQSDLLDKLAAYKDHRVMRG
eukprot:4216858-Amphidinium_carterae.1